MKNAIIAFISKNRKSMKKIIAFISRNYRKFLLWCGITILVILSITSIVFMIKAIHLSPNDPIFVHVAGNAAKLEVIKLIGWGMSGLIAILSVIGLLQRSAALDKQNDTNEKNYLQQAEALKKQHETNEKGHAQERFKAATEHLGNERVSMRITAFYEFYRLAKIESEPDLREHVFDILCAHLRKTTEYENGQEKEKDSGIPELAESKPTEEVQSLLKILFKPYKDNFIFVNMIADLEEVYLQKANLQNANLQNANLQNADLQKANLQDANLQNAYLQNAYLRLANLSMANLSMANLRLANLQEANLEGANLEGANLGGAHLQNAHLQKADLQKAYLQGADLQEANLEGVNLEGANLKVADLQKANLQGATIDRKTIMPHNWETMVEKNDDYNTGVLVVDEQGKIIGVFNPQSPTFYSQ